MRITVSETRSEYLLSQRNIADRSEITPHVFVLFVKVGKLHVGESQLDEIGVEGFKHCYGIECSLHEAIVVSIVNVEGF